MHHEQVTFEQIVAFAGGELDADEMRRVEAWLSLLPEAARDLARLRDVIRAIQADAASAPSPRAIRRALAAFGTPTPPAPHWIRAARRVIAELLFDGRSQPMLAGFRGPAGKDDGYQAAYGGEAGRLDLQVSAPQAGTSRWRLAGQVALAGGRKAGEAALVSAGEDAAAVTSTDAFGRFDLTAEPGVYDLLIELDGNETFVAPGVELGPDRG